MVNYKKIGDTLTTAELNAYASLLAHNKVLKDSFRLKNGVITGSYGNYEFDLTNASIVDNGILITDETLSNNITVKLTNPTQYATYTLHFTVIRYGDVNILEEPTENIETFDLTVDLITDTTINIPLESLQEYDIILFDSQITIKHDLPEIKGAYVTSLQLISDKLILQDGESATLTVTALDLDTLPVANKSIKLYKDGTLLDTLTTDANGQATKTITATSLAEITLQAKYQGTVTSEELVLNDTNLFDLTLTSNKDVMQTSETATLTATLLGDDTGLSGETITFEVYHNDTLQETLTGTTDSNGVATASYVGKGTGHLNIRANIDGIIQSETFVVYDCIFCEDGTLSNHKNWDNKNTNLNLVWYDDYTSMTQIDTSNFAWQSINCSDCCLEIDLKTTESFRVITFRQTGGAIGGRQITTGGMRINDGEWHHLKLYFEDSQLIVFVDDVQKSPISVTDISYATIQLEVTSGAELQYRNVKVYSI